MQGRNVITLDELTKYTPWVRQIVGVDNYERQNRSFDVINMEYNERGYSRVLKVSKKLKEVTEAQMDTVEFHHNQNPDIRSGCVSQHDILYSIDPTEHMCLRKTVFLSYISRYIDNYDTIIELGSGYGYNLNLVSGRYPGRNYIGGDISSNAVKASKLLFRDKDNITVKLLNFYDSEWELFKSSQPGQTLVFTWHAIEQLPDSMDVFKVLAKYRQNISMVIHFEPVYELLGDSTLDDLRRGYTILRDYNQNILTSITSSGGSIRHAEKDILGLNPLNPTSFIAWDFVK